MSSGELAEVAYAKKGHQGSQLFQKFIPYSLHQADECGLLTGLAVQTCLNAHVLPTSNIISAQTLVALEIAMWLDPFEHIVHGAVNLAGTGPCLMMLPDLCLRLVPLFFPPLLCAADFFCVCPGLQNLH